MISEYRTWWGRRGPLETWRRDGELVLLCENEYDTSEMQAEFDPACRHCTTETPHTQNVHVASGGRTRG